MDKIDLHTHSTFSADGISPLADMVGTANALGLKYYGVSEHFDYDYAALGLKVNGKSVPLIDAAAYFSAARALQRQYPFLLVGCEFGYADHPATIEACCEIIARYRPDFVVNSTHVCAGSDCYFGEYFVNRTKERAYGEYLECVRASLDAPYRYDIVAHIGYVSRNAPYEDKKLRYGDFADLYDDILKTVIAKNAILEVNTSTRGAGSFTLPDRDILSRYRELGGTALSFASDAHKTERIGAGYEETVRMLAELGFTHFTVPCRDRRVIVPFAR